MPPLSLHATGHVHPKTRGIIHSGVVVCHTKYKCPQTHQPIVVVAWTLYLVSHSRLAMGKKKEKNASGVDAYRKAERKKVRAPGSRNTACDTEPVCCRNWRSKRRTA